MIAHQKKIAIYFHSNVAEIACLQIRYKKRQELLERAAECIENCYGQETELSEAIRKEIN